MGAEERAAAVDVSAVPVGVLGQAEEGEAVNLIPEGGSPLISRDELFAVDASVESLRALSLIRKALVTDRDGGKPAYIYGQDIDAETLHVIADLLDEGEIVIGAIEITAP